VSSRMASSAYAPLAPYERVEYIWSPGLVSQRAIQGRPGPKNMPIMLSGFFFFLVCVCVCVCVCVICECVWSVQGRVVFFCLGELA